MANAPSITPLKPPNPLKQTTKHHPLSFNPNPHPHKLKRLSSFPTLAASSIALPLNVDYLKREFGGSGVRFEGLGDGACVVKMGLEDGSAASLMLPSGLITSYKPRMWHGGTVEVLHTTVSEGPDGEAVVRGGVSVDLSCVGGGLSLSADEWALLDVRGNSDKRIQVELISIGPKDTVEVKCLVTLQHDLLGSEIMIANRSSSQLELSGSVINHLTVSTPDATYAIGLQGSSYRCTQPTVSDFSIIPKDSREEKPLALWARKGFDGLFFSGNGRDRTDDEETVEEGEEDEDCKQMTEKSSRVYTDPPRELTILDRVMSILSPLSTKVPCTHHGYFRPPDR